MASVKAQPPANKVYHIYFVLYLLINVSLLGAARRNEGLYDSEELCYSLISAIRCPLRPAKSNKNANLSDYLNHKANGVYQSKSNRANWPCLSPLVKLKQ